MTKWVRLAHGGGGAFGIQAEDGSVAIHRGDMFDAPTPTGEIVPATAVVLRAPVAADELLEHCRDRLRQGHAPARVVVLDALPKTAGAKLDRAALKKLLVARVRP